VKATFFVVGQELDTYADLLRRAVDEGHCIGIHSDSHDYEEILCFCGCLFAGFQSDFLSVSRKLRDRSRISFRFSGRQYQRV